MNVGSKKREDWEKDEYRIALLSLWKSNGRTNAQIAKLMGITYTTLKVWMKESEPIKEALDTGKRELSDKIAGAMTRRAFGYDYEEVKTTIIGDVRKGSKVVENQQTVRIDKTTKHQPPDVGAQIFMLTNLRPEEWKNRQRVDTTVDGSLNTNVNLGEAVQIFIPDNGRDGVSDDAEENEQVDTNAGKKRTNESN